jgi:RHS repeat-associated protein
LQSILTTKGATTLQNLAYCYDRLGQVKSITDGVYSGSQGGSLSSITYDDLHRLTSYTWNSTTYNFSYSSIGNITVNPEFGAGTYTYGSSKPHAVTVANGKTYAYDASGNMTNRNGTALIYDEENQLVQYGSNITFGYADGGQRLWKSNAGQLTIWIGGIYEIKGSKTLCHVFAGGQRVATFEPQGALCAFLQTTPVVRDLYAFAKTATTWPLQEGRAPLTACLFPLVGILCVSVFSRRFSAFSSRGSGVPAAIDRHHARRWQWYQTHDPIAGSPTRRFAVSLVNVVLIVVLFVAVTPTQVEAGVCSPVFWYYHGDHLGSTNIITDRAGSLVWHYENYAFGKERYNNAACTFSISNRYTGQVFDDDTGLYYYNARYYDPELGRFIQPDTIVPDRSDPQAFNRYSYVEVVS